MGIYAVRLHGQDFLTQGSYALLHTVLVISQKRYWFVNLSNFKMVLTKYILVIPIRAVYSSALIDCLSCFRWSKAIENQ